MAQVGNSFVETSRELGISTICVHKGLSGGSRFGSPRDIGPAAVTHPEMNFVVYHCGFETKITEGPYTEATRDRGCEPVDLDAPGQRREAELKCLRRAGLDLVVPHAFSE